MNPSPGFLSKHATEVSGWDALDPYYRPLPRRTHIGWLCRHQRRRSSRPRAPPTGPHPRRINLLCRPDFHGALEFLLTVVFKVHQLGLAEDEPAPLPVPPGQRGGAAAFLVEPALLEGLLLGAEPQEGLVLQDAPAAFPGVH